MTLGNVSLRFQKFFIYQVLSAIARCQQYLKSYSFDLKKFYCDPCILIDKKIIYLNSYFEFFHQAMENFCYIKQNFQRYGWVSTRCFITMISLIVMFPFLKTSISVADIIYHYGKFIGRISYFRFFSFFFSIETGPSKCREKSIPSHSDCVW